MTQVDNIYAVAITISMVFACLFLIKAVHFTIRPGRVFESQNTEIQMLLDERDRLLLNLNDLRYDHAVEKVSEEDRDHMESELRGTLSDILQKLAALGVDVDLSKKEFIESGGRYGD